MKIVHLCLCGSYNDGWGYHDNYLSYYHKVLGNEVTIITTPFINDKSSSKYCFYKTGEYVDKNGIKIIRKNLKFSNKSKFSFRLRIYEELYESIESEKPDVIFIHCTQFFDIRKVIEYKKKHINVKIFADNHSDYINSARNFLSKNILHKIIWKSGIMKLIPYCEKFYGVTPLRCSFLIDMYRVPKDKVELLVMGADDQQINFKNRDEIRTSIRNKLSIMNDDFTIVTGGKIDEGKNIHKLMEAINKLDDNNIKLILFGTSTKNMESIISKMSKLPNVRDVGWIQAEKVYDYFLASDLAVFPGTHSTLWEQACGTGIPCVFKKYEGMQHVDVGGNCIFLNDDSIEQIIDTLKKIIYDKSLYKNMKKIALEKATKEFSYKEIARKSIQI